MIKWTDSFSTSRVIYNKENFPNSIILNKRSKIVRDLPNLVTLTETHNQNEFYLSWSVRALLACSHRFESQFPCTSSMLCDLKRTRMNKKEAGQASFILTHKMSLKEFTYWIVLSWWILLNRIWINLANPIGLNRD